MSDEKHISNNDWKVFEKRLEDMPDELELGIFKRSFTKSGLMKEVKKKSDVVIAYAEMQLGYIKWLVKQYMKME